MNTLPPPLRIANTAAVLDGPYGAVTRQATRCGTSRQALYRDVPKVLQAVDGSQARQRLQELHDDNDRLRVECDRLRRQLQQAVVLDTDRLACFAATAQAEGVSLPVARRLLLPLLQQRTPRVPTLGRWAKTAAQKADALLSVLDAVARPRVEQAAADEIFFGRRPCLMVVEQQSLCWLTGRLADDRNGETWAEEFRRLDDPVWAKTRRALTRPQLLTFLDRTQQQLAALPLSATVREAAVQVEGLCQRPERLRGASPSAAALRGIALATALVLSLSGPMAVEAVSQVRQVVRQAWRSSSLVECLNSVARMEQSRHRRMTQGLLSLKRLYCNCRTFCTGRRRKQTPYGLLGMQLPTTDWWELLRLSPEQLRQQLSAPGVAA